MNAEPHVLSDPKKITNKKLLTYLLEIDFDNKEFSSNEQQTIILQAIADYNLGKVPQNFVIGLAYLFDTTASQDSHELNSVICGLSEYNFRKINDKKVSYSKPQIERSFQWAQILLGS